MVNFVKWCIQNNGDIIPLNLPSFDTRGTSVCNPSILVNDEQLVVNLRHVNYILYHSEFPIKWGPQYSSLCYLHPENDCNLKTTNYLAYLNSQSLKIESYNKIDTSRCDIEPKWNFVGLEDIRLVKWENKLYGCGVRRDVKADGEGRIELSELDKNQEIVRYRIEPPFPSYCEKNWMPILDMPFCFVKWSNPTEIVKVNLEKKNSSVIYYVEQNLPHIKNDLRGSSQVINWENFYLGLVHETDFWYTPNKSKNARYYHRFVVWDKKWNIIKVSQKFNFIEGWVEFCCGMCVWKDYLIISFAFCDNASYLLKIPLIKFNQFLNL